MQGALIIPLLLVIPASIGLLQQRQSKIGPHTCHESPDPVQALEYLSTKRPYSYQHDDRTVYTPPGCSAVKFWYFGRHGTRYPGEEDIVGMQGVLPGLFDEIRGSNSSQLCPDTLSSFKTWRPNPLLNVSTDSYLHPQGYYELASIASRYVARYPSLFPSVFANSTYHFRFTDAQRTNASARSFASSIFPSPESVWFPQPVKDDPVLKFYSTCRKWEEEVDKNPEALREYNAFVASATMNGTIQSVSRRVGLHRNLTLQELTLMYTTCAFETAWGNGSLSQWCSVFRLDELSVMEYAEDLEYYWKDGYGFRVNYEQACVALWDAVRFFDEYPGEQPTTELDYRRTQAYFSHSGATLKMLARLGLFNDTLPLTSDGFESVREAYKWRTSVIDTMGSNMALVMFNCNSTQQVKERTQIGLLFQERNVALPACGGSHFCSYEEFRGNVAGWGECEMDRICGV